MLSWLTQNLTIIWNLITKRLIKENIWCEKYFVWDTKQGLTVITDWTQNLT